MPDIEVKGTVVSNEDKWIYDFFGIDSVCPRDVATQLERENGQDVTVQINSGGGDIFAGNEIYYLIASYGGRKTVDIVGFAASAATIIACAGDIVRAVPGAQYMIHNVSSSQSGDFHAMDKESQVLQNANKSISNIYRIKTGMSEKDLLKLMDSETWMDVTKAVEYGFVDEVIGDNGTLLKPFSIYNSVANVLSEEVKEKIRNTVKRPSSRIDGDALLKAKETLRILKMKGEIKNVQIQKF